MLKRLRVCSGLLPAYRGDEIHSRLLSLNGWMSRWCPQNNIGFIDNWTSFWGRPDLLKRDGIHPSWGGAALLSRNMAHSVRVGDEGMWRGLTNAGEWDLLNNIKQNSNKNYPVEEKQVSWQGLAGQGKTKQGSELLSELETTHSHNETERGARASGPRLETKTQDMSAGIQLPRSNTKQGTQMREHMARALEAACSRENRT